ncbi:MAG: electron transfer flavoprotein subunit alpha/FixB family protein [Elusimicrobiaceae bacterium]|nr:electron transfer flavoprotein subunit alpha/FixB family protein [Elusimicrobiaceae bacterium]
MRIDETTRGNYAGVWIYAEVLHGALAPTALELLNGGRALADAVKAPLCAVLLGHNVARFSQTLVEHGADRVYIVDAPALENFVDGVHAKTLAALVREHKPDKVIIPASTIGRSLAAKAAIELETGLTADATDIAIDSATGLMHATRPTFGGNLMATIACRNHRPEMVSLRPLTYEPAKRQPGRTGELVNFPFRPDNFTSKAVFKEFIAELSEELDIGGAEVIVSGGRGLGDTKGFELLRQLASAMGGAVGASRAAVDSGWISFRHQVGLTGRTVKPKLYIAAGISGQVQHLAGMRSSGTVVAINKDPEAPIMKHAHYALTGDLYEIIPAMIERFKRA